MSERPAMADLLKGFTKCQVKNSRVNCRVLGSTSGNQLNRQEHDMMVVQ